MVARAPDLATFEELYARIARLPEGVTGEILEAGSIRTMSRPGRRHRHAAKACLISLAGFDRGQGGGGWWIEVEAEIRFGDRLAVPDLAGWRTERVDVLPEDNPLTMLPDWCCEVLSPHTAREDRMLKLPLYARSGVAHTWLVDPALETVEVYETVGGRATLAATAARAETVALPPFDRPISLASWWVADASV